MKSKTDPAKPHIVLCAPRQTGKTTLIERIIREARESAAGSPIPIYGFQTKKFAGSDGTSRIYMFPAGGDLPGSIPAEARYIGSTCGRVKDVCPETFDTYGTALIRSARPGGLLIMDEIGHMEKNSPLFLRAVFEALDGDIPVLAVARYTEGDAAPAGQPPKAGDQTVSGDYLERIRRHPRVRLYMLTEDNRDAVYDEVRDILFTGRKEAKDHEPL